MIFAVLIFVVSTGFLYVKTRNYVREDALRRASQVLNNTVLRVSVILNEVEIATNNTDWLVRTHLHPDSVVVYSRRLIEMNPNFKGCSISFEPLRKKGNISPSILLVKTTQFVPNRRVATSIVTTIWNGI